MDSSTSPPLTKQEATKPNLELLLSNLVSNGKVNTAIALQICNIAYENTKKTEDAKRKAGEDKNVPVDKAILYNEFALLLTPYIESISLETSPILICAFENWLVEDVDNYEELQCYSNLDQCIRNKLSKKLIDHYTRTEKELSDLLQSSNLQHSLLATSARPLFNTIQEARKTALAIDLLLLSEVLQQTTAAIKQPNHPDTLKKYSELTAKLLKKYPPIITSSEKKNNSKSTWKQKIGGLALIFLGVLLITASLYLATVTFGAATPLSIAGIKLGLTSITTGAAAATVIATGTCGITTSIAGTMIVAKKSNNVRRITSTTVQHPIATAASKFYGSLNQSDQEPQKDEKTSIAKPPSSKS